MPRRFERWHRQLRAHAWLQRFTLLCRTLLALGFLAAGLTKVFGAPFADPVDPATPLNRLHPMLAFFEAFHGIGPYYAFVGAVQVAASLLLLSRRTALLGAVLYFPTVLNISILTVASDFGPFLGTQVITIFMVLACAWLLVWDAHRLAPLFSEARLAAEPRAQEPPVWKMLVPSVGEGQPRAARYTLRGAWLLGFTGTMTFWLIVRGPFSRPSDAILAALILSVPAAALLTVTGWALWWWQGGAEAGSHASEPAAS